MQRRIFSVGIIGVIFLLSVVALASPTSVFNSVFKTQSISDKILANQKNDDKTIYFILFHHLALIKEKSDKSHLTDESPFDYLESYKTQAKLDDVQTQFLFQTAEDWAKEFKPIEEKINAIVKQSRNKYPKGELESANDQPLSNDLTVLWEEKDKTVLKYKEILQNTLGEEQFANFNKFAVDKIAPNVDYNILNQNNATPSSPPIGSGCYGYSLYDVDSNNPAIIRNMETGTVLFCSMVDYYDPGIQSFLFKDDVLISSLPRRICTNCSYSYDFTGQFNGESEKTYKIRGDHWVRAYYYYNTSQGPVFVDGYGLNFYQGNYPPPYGFTNYPTGYYYYNVYKAASTQISYRVPKPALHLDSVDRTGFSPSDTYTTTLRGTGLFGNNQSIQVSGSGVTARVKPNQTPNTTETLQIELDITQDTQRGERQLTLSVNGMTSNALTITIGDNDPTVSDITPPEGNEGENVNVEILGSNFGLNPQIRISGTGVQATILTATQSRITAVFSIANGAIQGMRDVTITSRGYGGTGFITVQGSSDTSEVMSFEVIAPIVAKIQFKKNGVWTDVSSSSLSSICNGSSVEFKAIPNRGSFASGKPVWGGSASGTGATTTVTFNNSGSQIISATSGNTISVNATVGQSNNATVLEWLPPTIITVPTGNSTTTTKDTEMQYEACADIQNNTWNLRVKSAKAGTSIELSLENGRDPDVNPPTTSIQASDAVRELNAYFDFGTRRWHKLSATEAHERMHDSEAKCTNEHYWGQTETTLERLTVPFTNYSNANDAITALKLNGANAKITAFQIINVDYETTLSDEPGVSRAYAAGQIVLNGAIERVRTLAASRGWRVGSILHPNPNVSQPCYQPFLPYNP